MKSLPDDPVNTSCPDPPKILSLPAWPLMMSSPSPPEITSSPPPPLMVSCPPSPRMQSGPEVPVIVLLFDVPTMMLDPGGQHAVLLPSTAVTFWVATAVFPAASRAVQVTVVVPSGNTLGLLLVMVTPQGSVAVAW